jgi:hypothetical protein
LTSECQRKKERRPCEGRRKQWRQENVVKAITAEKDKNVIKATVVVNISVLSFQNCQFGFSMYNF